MEGTIIGCLRNEGRSNSDCTGRARKVSRNVERWNFDKALRRPGAGSAGTRTLQSKERNQLPELGGKVSEISVWLETGR